MPDRRKPISPGLHPDLDAARGIALAVVLCAPFWALLYWRFL